MSGPSGILSDGDKEYLLGHTEFEGENADEKENMKRFRLRKKLTNAIDDFTLLMLKLDEKDREMVFEEAPIDGMRCAIEFIYGGMRDNSNLQHGDVLREAIAQVEDRRAPPGTVVDKVDINVSFTERDPDVDLLRERLEEGEPLSDSEVGRLVRVGALGPEELEDVQWNYEKWDLDEIEYRRSNTHPRED